jgi:hypothetical protein
MSTEKTSLENENQPSCLVAVMPRFLMEFMLNGKVEREEVDCEDWSKAKHFIQRKYKLQDEPRVIREVKTYA